MTHPGPWAAQGIPSQVPSCQKESKTQPAAMSGRIQEAPGTALYSPWRGPGPGSQVCKGHRGSALLGFSAPPRDRCGPGYRSGSSLCGCLLPAVLAGAREAPSAAHWVSRPQWEVGYHCHLLCLKASTLPPLPPLTATLPPLFFFLTLASMP